MVQGALLRVVSLTLMPLFCPLDRIYILADLRGTPSSYSSVYSHVWNILQNDHIPPAEEQKNMWREKKEFPEKLN